MTVNLICVHLIRCSQAALGSTCNVQIFGTVRNAHTHTHMQRVRQTERQTNKQVFNDKNVAVIYANGAACNGGGNGQTFAGFGKCGMSLSSVLWQIH